MLSKRQIFGVASAVTLAAGLAACGSSDDGDGGAPAPAPPPASVPPSASGSVGAFIAFLLSLASSETAEPLTVGSFTAPTDDTIDPTPL